MATLPSSSEWIAQVFNAKAVATGGVVRRSVEDVHTYASYEQLLHEVKTRGFHLVETGGQYVILCNGGDIKVHV